MVIPAAHFSHPQHELKLSTKYHLPHFCNLCGEKLTGSGGYSCHGLLCDFHLHEECTRYPETLRAFFTHPWHDLTLARTDDQRVCDLCREEVPAGVFLYRCACAPCGFDVHPRCSRLPQMASSMLHPYHCLCLTTALPGVGTCCAACRQLCYAWVYRCGLCNFDLHIECLHGARSSGGKKNGKQDGSSSSSSVQELGVEVLKTVTEDAVGMFLENKNNNNNS